MRTTTGTTKTATWTPCFSELNQAQVHNFHQNESRFIYFSCAMFCGVTTPWTFDLAASLSLITSRKYSFFPFGETNSFTGTLVSVQCRSSRSSKKNTSQILSLWPAEKSHAGMWGMTACVRPVEDKGSKHWLKINKTLQNYIFSAEDISHTTFPQSFPKTQIFLSCIHEQTGDTCFRLQYLHFTYQLDTAMCK